MHWPVTLLRWKFGPQPPNANAGVTADDRATERKTTPAAAQHADKRTTRSAFMTISPSIMRLRGSLPLCVSSGAGGNGCRHGTTISRFVMAVTLGLDPHDPR